MPIFKEVGQEALHELIAGCECGDNEHQVKMMYFDDDPDFFIEPLLTYWEGFFKRLVFAVKYVFGYKSRFGQFDEILLDKEDVREIVTFMKGFLNER